MNDLYSKIISELFKRFVTINWIKTNLGSPLILFSKSTYMIFIFNILTDSLGMQFGSTASSYSPPRLTTNLTGETVTRQILTDVVTGLPRVRNYSICTESDKLLRLANFVKHELSKISNLTGFSIFNSLDYIKILEELVSSCYGSTASDVFMLFASEGTIFNDCIISHANMTSQFSQGLANFVKGDFMIQEIVPYDINAILTYKGTGIDI